MNEHCFHKTAGEGKKCCFCGRESEPIKGEHGPYAPMLILPK